MRIGVLSLILPAALWFSCGVLHAQLSVGGLFADHMVIQRRQPIAVWGTAEPGVEVSVSLGDRKASAKAASDGKWRATLDPLEASGPFELEVSRGADAKVVKDVMIGDVWLISGQSNVVLALQSTTEWPEAKTAGVFPGIRICKVPGSYAFEPAGQFSRPLSWEVLNSAKAGYFSGVGYHFARTVQPAIGVTLGLIQGSVGGTQIEQWTPESAIRAAHPESRSLLERDKARAALEADPKAKISGTLLGAGSMYNSSIYPLLPAKLAGVVWYQGEANTRTKVDYRPLLKTFVLSWREAFGQPDLSFVIVQLPKFGLPKDDGWMRVQEAQRLAARDLGLPLVVTIDEGSPATIHPPNKAEVGRRAGLAALQHVYKQNVEGTGPFVKSVKFEGDSAIVEFDGFKGDLVLKGEGVKGFELAGADKVFQPAAAEIHGRSVEIKAAGVAQPKAVRYLWANSPDAITLYSPAGLPAGPFRAER